MEPIGAWSRKVVDANSLKDMVGPCGLDPQTSTVSTIRCLRERVTSQFKSQNASVIRDCGRRMIALCVVGYDGGVIIHLPWTIAEARTCVDIPWELRPSLA